MCEGEISTPQIQKAVFALIRSAIAMKATAPQIQGLAAGVTVGAMLSKTEDDSINNSIIDASLELLLGAVLTS